MSLIIRFNNTEYEAIFNNETGYYEAYLNAPDIGGIYTANLNYVFSTEDIYTDNIKVQIFSRKRPKLDLNKIFMWIFDYSDFSLKDIVEISDYEFIIDEETNGFSTINILKETSANAKDFIVVKKDNEDVFWGIIDKISNNDGENLYTFSCKYITNMFNQDIELINENLIRTTGVEDFIGDAISRNYITNTDTFLNKSYLQLNVRTHTTKNVSVTNVENRIYNLHTWLTNCTQNYDIVYSFSILNKNLVISIENKSYDKLLIDTNALNISNYSEVFETEVTSKVIVLYDKVNEVEQAGKYTLYLLNDRTTTTNMTNVNRAKGNVTTVYTENFEDAEQTALDEMKGNLYNHNITFDLADTYIKIGTPIAIKTKKSAIYDTYISSITLKPNKMIKYQCGNIRINFIEKLLKEKKK